MDSAYVRLRRHRVEHASSGPQRLPDWNRNPERHGTFVRQHQPRLIASVCFDLDRELALYNCRTQLDELSLSCRERSR